jgi:hypothetical protein
MVSGSTRKEQLTRSFSLMETGGMNRSYLFSADPNMIDSGEGLQARAEWMEAIELATGVVGLDSFKEKDVDKIIDAIMVSRRSPMILAVVRHDDTPARL